MKNSRSIATAIGSTARPLHKQRFRQRVEVVLPASARVMVPGRATGSLATLHPVSEANITNPEAANLPPEDLALLSSTDASHILNAACSNCAKKKVLCVKRFGRKACKPCAEKKMGCPMSGEVSMYWNRVRPNRSRSRTSTPGPQPRRPPSRGTTPSHPSGTPSLGHDKAALDSIKTLQEQVTTMERRLETVERKWAAAELKAQHTDREIVSLRILLHDQEEGTPKAGDNQDVPPPSGPPTSTDPPPTPTEPLSRPFSQASQHVPPPVGDGALPASVVIPLAPTTAPSPADSPTEELPHPLVSALNSTFSSNDQADNDNLQDNPS